MAPAKTRATAIAVTGALLLLLLLLLPRDCADKQVAECRDTQSRMATATPSGGRVWGQAAAARGSPPPPPPPLPQQQQPPQPPPQQQRVGGASQTFVYGNLAMVSPADSLATRIQRGERFTPAPAPATASQQQQQQQQHSTPAAPLSLIHI